MIKKIDSVSRTGLVLFVDDTRKGGTTNGTEDDCLQYGYLHQSGECYAFLSNNEIVPQKQGSISNNLPNRNYVTGRNNRTASGSENVILGDDNLINLGANHSIVKGRNAYTENYGENVYSAQIEANTSRYIELGYAGYTTDAASTEIFVGNNKAQRFYLNTDYATAWFVEWNVVALNADSGEMWTKTNYQAFRYIAGTFAEVGNHTGTVLRDSNLDYDILVQPITLTNGRSYFVIAVEGEANHNVCWNATFKITEIRKPEIKSANQISNPDFLGTPSWQKINQDANNIITIPVSATDGGGQIVGNGARNCAMRLAITWGTAKWKITFDLEEVAGQTLKTQVRVNNQNSQVFTTPGTHSYYVDTVGGANFIQFMVNSTTGAGGCIINNVKAETITF